MTNPQNGAQLKLFHSIKSPVKRAFREHHHAELEISLFKSGTGTYRVLNNSYDFQSGDVFLFGTNSIHCITEINSPLTLMNIRFEPRFVWSAGSGLLSPDVLNIFFSQNAAYSNRLDRKNPATEEIRRLMLEIENEFVVRDREYELMINIKLLNIFAKLLRCYPCFSKTSLSVNESSLRCLDRAINYINENLKNELSLSEIAAKANMSRTYFSTLFKKLNGISPWEYITIKRVEEAIELLKQNNKTVLDIAIECGFNSTANFNRAFRKVTGKIPSDYKK